MCILYICLYYMHVFYFSIFEFLKKTQSGASPKPFPSGQRCLKEMSENSTERSMRKLSFLTTAGYIYIYIYIDSIIMNDQCNLKKTTPINQIPEICW